MKQRRIVMAVTNDLEADQRVDRNARTLAEAGCSVLLIGRRRRREPRSLCGRSYGTERMLLLFRRSALFYAEYNLRLFLRLMTVRADAFFANDTDTLLGCALAAVLRRRRLFFDAHELFPDVPELVDKPRVRRVWQWVERRCLPRVDGAFTVCQSVADCYRKRYGTVMTVVRNLPERSAVEALSHRDSYGFDFAAARRAGASVLLYQGAVNIGRGVREAIDVLEYLPGCRLVVAGAGDELAALSDYAAGREWSGRVAFLGRVLPAELHRLTPQADLGLCLLEDLGLNYRYSLPNRIGDFVAAGVPILATDFPEIGRVLRRYPVGALAESCPAEKAGDGYVRYLRRLARTIENALAEWKPLSPAEREARFASAREDLCWEKEKKRLLDAVGTIIPPE